MLPAMTSAIVMEKTGGPEVLQWAEVELPPPGPGEVQIRHEAVGLNMIDTYHRKGVYPVELPSGLGMEGAGVVEAVGDGVDGLPVGQRVAYATGPAGSYAEARNMPWQTVVPLPDDVDARTAAAAMLKGLTVSYLIRETFAVQKGMTVLWHAAAGGVGLIACQWLSHLGVEVIGTVSTEEKAERARAHGCTHTILYKDEDFVARVRDLAPDGVPVVYDSVGAATFEGSLKCLRPRGMMVSFGNASGPVEPISPLTLTQHGSLFLTRPTLFHYTSERAELLDHAAALFGVIASGAVKLHVGQTFPLREAAEAHRALEARETEGSTVFLP